MWPIPVRIHESRQGRHAAAVLFFHGLRSSSEILEREARTFAAAGVTTILPDAPHHGARRSAFLDTMPDTSTVEGYRRLLAILREARDEVPRLVDHALALGYERVAVGGVSMGGYIALAAATIEPRIAAIASLLGSPDWTPREGEAAEHVDAFGAALVESPHLRPETFPPRPILLLNGARDMNVRPEPARAFAAVLRPLYDALGASGALVQREYDAPHFVPEPTWKEMIATTAAFLARALENERCFANE